MLKEGPAEDYANREEIAKLLRFASTAGEGEAQTVSRGLRWPHEGRSAEDLLHHRRLLCCRCQNSPHLEIFRKKGVEVLLMWERVDEWLMSHLTEFDGKQLVSVTRGELDLGIWKTTPPSRRRKRPKKPTPVWLSGSRRASVKR